MEGLTKVTCAIVTIGNYYGNTHEGKLLKLNVGARKIAAALERSSS